MDEKEIEEWVKKNIHFSFSRSSGPGGQNVNKRDTKVAAGIPLTSINILTDDERALIKSKLSHRLNSKGELIIQVQDTRSQSENREIAVERIISLLKKALERNKKRRPTLPTRPSQEKRINKKKIIGKKKRLRGQIDSDE
jgi:ribosome-associated protein